MSNKLDIITHRRSYEDSILYLINILQHSDEEMYDKELKGLNVYLSRGDISILLDILNIEYGRIKEIKEHND